MHFCNFRRVTLVHAEGVIVEYQDLFKIIESQQRAFVALQKQVLHLATLTGQEDDPEINSAFDLVLTELNNVRRIMYRQDEEQK